jgi:predicted HD phosphohydrolase
LLHNIGHILKEKGTRKRKKKKNYMEEQFGEMVKLLKFTTYIKVGKKK